MKKGIAIVLVAIFLLCLGGCADIELPVIETEPVIIQDLVKVPQMLYLPTGSLSLSLTDANGNVSGPYVTMEIPEHLSLGLCTVLDDVNVSKYDRFLTIESGDGAIRLTIYDSYRDILCVESGGTISYFRDSDGTTFDGLRQDFDTIEYEARRMPSFYYYESGDPLREFAGSVYPAFRTGLSYGSRFRYEDYDLIFCRADEQTETTITGEIGYFAIIDQQILPEDAEAGTGSHEGWYFIRESVKLELQDDGAWHQVEEFSLTETDPTE